MSNILQGATYNLSEFTRVICNRRSKSQLPNILSNISRLCVHPRAPLKFRGGVPLGRTFGRWRPSFGRDRRSSDISATSIMHARATYSAPLDPVPHVLIARTPCKDQRTPPASLRRPTVPLTLPFLPRVRLKGYSNLTVDWFLVRF